jgi:hypothetical protein
MSLPERAILDCHQPAQGQDNDRQPVPYILDRRRNPSIFRVGLIVTYAQSATCCIQAEPASSFQCSPEPPGYMIS